MVFGKLSQGLLIANMYGDKSEAIFSLVYGFLEF